jgi:hypothetical protein
MIELEEQGVQIIEANLPINTAESWPLLKCCSTKLRDVSRNEHWVKLVEQIEHIQAPHTGLASATLQFLHWFKQYSRICGTIPCTVKAKTDLNEYWSV